MKQLVATLTLPQVNQALRAAGIKDKLVRGKGYFYFVGDATNWPNSSVGVYSLDELTPAEWVAEYKRLKEEGDPNSIARRNEERYGKKRK